MNDRCFPKLKLKKGDRVLDVGSGLGQLTFRMSQFVGENGFCLGIERDTKQLEAAIKSFQGSNLEFRKGDALELVLENEELNSFDFVHTRFLLEHLPHPNRAVAQMIKALKPGGRIFLADDDHQAMTLFPEPTGFQKLWTAYMDSYVEVGNDPFIGRKLPKLLQDNEIKNITNDVVFFGDCSGTPTFQLFVDNLIEVIIPSREIMIRINSISEREFDESIEKLREWSGHASAAIWYTICIAEGIK
jgi:ubiquinone/menaquinone biosynthesis C-methylase UbiE